MREILTEWSTAAGGGFLSVMYFDEAVPVEAQRAALGALWGDIDANMPTTTSWNVQTDGRVIDDVTGALQGFWSDDTPYTDSGDGTGTQPWADSTQMLLRWRTDTIVRGRLLQGRTFVPGLATGNIQGGNLGPTTQAAVNAALALFIADTGLRVWSRPVGSVGGSSAEVSSASVWSELAVLRRRRQ